MQININLEQSQIELLAQKMGYKKQVEDTSQPIEGDSYPLIDNPITLTKFTEDMINQTLMNMIMDRLRADLKVNLDSQHNKIIQKLIHGGYDTDILTLAEEDVLVKIKGDLVAY